jgi:hypothetical protein
VRVISGLLFAILLTLPRAAASQSIEVYGSAGPTLQDAGESIAAGVGFQLHPRLTILATVERTHLRFRTTNDHGVISSFRGGTLLLGTAELRVLPFGRGHAGPYGLAGLGAGVSHPTVSDVFPNRVTNQVRTFFFGGGFTAPFGDRLSAFADARLMIGAEGADGFVAAIPVRAGLSWRF